MQMLCFSLVNTCIITWGNASRNKRESITNHPNEWEQYDWSFVVFREDMLDNVSKSEPARRRWRRDHRWWESPSDWFVVFWQFGKYSLKKCLLSIQHITIDIVSRQMFLYGVFLRSECVRSVGQSAIGKHTLSDVQRILWPNCAKVVPYNLYCVSSSLLNPQPQNE